MATCIVNFRMLVCFQLFRRTSVLTSYIGPVIRNTVNLEFVRHRRKYRGIHPEDASSLQERLAEIEYKDPAVHYHVDIGFPVINKLMPRKERLAVMKKQYNNKELEYLAQKRELLISLDDVKKEWIQTSSPDHIYTIADHYGIFSDLYGDAYFKPSVMLNVVYHFDEDTVSVVHRGNILKPSEVRSTPTVEFTAEPDSLWTLILTNPDGHLTDNSAEVLHWFVGNIPGSDVTKGDIISPYLPPFPPRGTGYQRMVFVLYKQEQKIDYSDFKRQEPLTQKEQTFSTFEFYRDRQDVLTPAGLAFYQTDWDSSVTDYYHNVLNMQEPIFEYDFPPPYIRPQEWFPKKKPFNIYLDKYRDPRDVAQDILLDKLKFSHPFRQPQKEPKYPNAFPEDRSMPMWQRVELRKKRLKMGKYKFYDY